MEEYIALAVDMTVGRGIEAQVAAFKDGFNCVFAIQDLAGFRSEELVNLFGSGEEDWSYESKCSAILDRAALFVCLLVERVDDQPC